MSQYLTRTRKGARLRHMVDSPAPVLLVGRRREPEPMAEVRSEAQRRVVAETAAADDFDFACGNPFVPEVGDYVGPFSFIYYTTDGELHLKRIGKTGRILKEVTR